MPCYSPLDGWRHRETNGFTMRPQYALRDQPLTVSCGQCIGCRLERSRQWAVRCMHESQCHDENCFITLTYNDDNLPFAASLQRRDFQLFMKRLIKKSGQPIRLYYCGEYGPTTRRPHYHACLFGWRPTDPLLFSQGSDYKLYESPLLTSVWGLGHATFGELTFDSAAYCARYITEKITGEPAQDHYTYIDDETGECFPISPEFNGMSRRPGIGKPWHERYGTEVGLKDEVIMSGRPMRPPRAYDRWFEHTDPETWLSIKEERSNKPRIIRTERQLRAASIIAKSRMIKRSNL